MKSYIPIFALLLAFQSMVAQTPDKCAFDNLYQEMMQNSLVLQKIQENEDKLSLYKNTPQERSLNTIQIPCVVHILHNGQALGVTPNIVDAQINSAIADMTNAFKHTGYYASNSPSAPAGVTNVWNAVMDVEFVLAKTAPDGTATSGILRHNVTGKSYASNYMNNGIDPEGGATVGVPDQTIKQDYFWSPLDYMNIWVVHEVENDVSTLGYASFPNTSSGATDGLTMLASAFGRNDGVNNWLLDPSTNLNGTANHETGHYLNLFHSFEGDNNGCPANGNPNTDGDKCADIVPHQRTNSVCPTLSSTGNTCASNGQNHHIHNFMDYSNDACFFGFSADQKTRMDAALAGPRANLNSSKANENPSGTYPVAAVVSPQSLELSNGYDLGISSITLNGTTWTSWNTYNDGGYCNRVATQPTVTLINNNAYSISISTSSASDAESVSVYIDYNNNGSFADAGEEVGTSASLSGGSNSFTASSTHNISFTPSVPSPSASQRLRLRVISDYFDTATNLTTGNGNYAPTQGGQVEDYSVIITTVLPVELVNFSAKAKEKSISLNWETSQEINSKGFEIERSENESADYQFIGFVEGNENSNTPQTYQFIDEDAKAETTYYYRLKQLDTDGNHTYSEAVSAKIKARTTFEIQPNPAKEFVNIRFSTDKVNDIQINLIGLDGKLLKSISQSNIEDYQLDLGDTPNGSYFLQILTGNNVEIRKLLVLK